MSLTLEQRLDTLPAGAEVAWCGQQYVTAGQLRADVATLASWLAAHPARHWALCLDDAYAFTVALLACGMAGCVAVLPGHRRPAGLEEQAPYIEALLVDGDWSSAVLSFPVCHWQAVMAAPVSAAPTTPWPAPLSVLMFTSGSTGVPQAILKQERELLAEVEIQAGLWADALAGAVILATVSQQHIYGLLFRILLPLRLGLPLAAATCTTPEQLQAAVRGLMRPWALISSPAFLEHLDPELSCPGARWLVSSGGPLSASGAALSQRCLGLSPVELYGSSETGGIAWRQQHGSDWMLLPGLTLSVDAAETWWLTSPFLPAGQRWALSDRLVWQENGFRLLGRADRVIKLAEKRISLDEVERRLRAVPWIAEAAVVPLEIGGRRCLGAVLIPSAEGWRLHATLGEGRLLLQLRQALRPWLEPVALPRRLRCLSAMPVNSQGKRPYAVLKELFDVAIEC